jgi:hypothetical protein
LRNPTAGCSLIDPPDPSACAVRMKRMIGAGLRNLGCHYVTVRRVRGDVVVHAMRIVRGGGRVEDPRAIHTQKSTLGELGITIGMKITTSARVKYANKKCWVITSTTWWIRHFRTQTTFETQLGRSRSIASPDMPSAAPGAWSSGEG